MFLDIFSRIQRSFASTLFISFFRPVTTVLLSSSESIHFVPAIRVFDSPIFFIPTLLKFFKGRLCLISVWKCKLNMSQSHQSVSLICPIYITKTFVLTYIANSLIALSLWRYLWTTPYFNKTNSDFKISIKKILTLFRILM